MGDELMGGRSIITMTLFDIDLKWPTQLYNISMQKDLSSKDRMVYVGFDLI
jgi:hypothetical protein